tara:strand:+ start:300 stop:515 length:216 start_codon:yes stop_codon:yes gene_type:complete
MHLRDWLFKYNITYKTFAEMVNTSPRNVERWARGEVLPRSMDAEKIFISTNDEVTGTDLYEKQIQRKKTGL